MQLHPRRRCVPFANAIHNGPSADGRLRGPSMQPDPQNYHPCTITRAANPAARLILFQKHLHVPEAPSGMQLPGQPLAYERGKEGEREQGQGGGFTSARPPCNRRRRRKTAGTAHLLLRCPCRGPPHCFRPPVSPAQCLQPPPPPPSPFQLNHCIRHRTYSSIMPIGLARCGTHVLLQSRKDCLQDLHAETRP